LLSMSCQYGTRKRHTVSRYGMVIWSRTVFIRLRIMYTAKHGTVQMAGNRPFFALKVHLGSFHNTNVVTYTSPAQHCLIFVKFICWSYNSYRIGISSHHIASYRIASHWYCIRIAPGRIRRIALELTFPPSAVRRASS
jgi:hypothetical protein